MPQVGQKSVLAIKESCIRHHEIMTEQLPEYLMPSLQIEADLCIVRMYSVGLEYCIPGEIFIENPAEPHVS